MCGFKKEIVDIPRAIAPQRPSLALVLIREKWDLAAKYFAWAVLPARPFIVIKGLMCKEAAATFFCELNQ